MGFQSLTPVLINGTRFGCGALICLNLISCATTPTYFPVPQQCESLLNSVNDDETESKPEFPGGLSPKPETCILDARKNDFGEIYRRHFSADHESIGVVTLNLTVRPNGTVSDVFVEFSDLDSPQFIEELSALLKRIKFWQAPSEFVISYPLDFSHL